MFRILNSLYLSDRLEEVKTGSFLVFPVQDSMDFNLFNEVLLILRFGT